MKDKYIVWPANIKLIKHDEKLLNDEVIYWSNGRNSRRLMDAEFLLMKENGNNNIKYILKINDCFNIDINKHKNIISYIKNSQNINSKFKDKLNYKVDEYVKNKSTYLKTKLFKKLDSNNEINLEDIEINKNNPSYSFVDKKFNKKIDKRINSDLFSKEEYDDLLIKAKKNNNNLSKEEKNKLNRFILSEYINRNPLGQKNFRNQLIKEVEEKNILMDKYQDMLDIIKDFDEKSNILIASHIIDFKYCGDENAFDSNNGLLLPSFIDPLFDKKLISFNHLSGKIILSEIIEDVLPKEIINYLRTIKINDKYLNDTRRKNLKWHNENLK